MNLIVAVDKNWGIGHGGGLLFSIPEDLRRFRALTENRVVIYGRSTLKTFPGARPLKNRVNIMLSRDPALSVAGAVVCGSLGALRGVAAAYREEDVFVIGGQSVYEQLLDGCRCAYVTKVDAAREADSFFPDLDAAAGWALAEESPAMAHGGLTYRFVKYVNRAA